MSKWWLQVSSGVAFIVSVAFASGCSDDKSTGSNDLTQEEQFEEISKFFNFDPDDDGNGNTLEIMNLFLGSIPGEYLAGVGNPGGAGKRALQSIFPELDLASVDHDTAWANYHPATGWWEVYFSADLSDGQSSFDLEIRDSLRFETASGAAEIQPTELTSLVRFREQLALDALGVILDEDLNAIGDVDIKTTGRSRFDVGGLNLADASINGTSVLSLDFDGTVEDTTVELLLALETDVDGLTIPTSDTDGDACPTDGSINGSLALDLSVEAGNESAAAQGTFDAAIDFTGNGNATVEVESGDFTKTYSGNACTPEP